MAKMTTPKRVIGTISGEEGRNKEFKLAKHSRDKNSKADQTDEITLALSDIADTIIEILSTEGLQEESEPGNPIIWINNFAIRRKSTNEYLDQEYTVYLPPHPKGYGTFVYQVGDTLYKDRKPKPVDPKNPDSKLVVILQHGDPGTGWTRP